MTNQTAPTAREIKTLHMAGLGQYRPMGDTPIARADSLVERGFLARNPRTGIYFLTATGASALAAA